MSGFSCHCCCCPGHCSTAQYRHEDVVYKRSMYSSPLLVMCILLGVLFNLSPRSSVSASRVLRCYGRQIGRDCHSAIGGWRYLPPRYLGWLTSDIATASRLPTFLNQLRLSGSHDDADDIVPPRADSALLSDKLSRRTPLFPLLDEHARTRPLQPTSARPPNTSLGWTVLRARAPAWLILYYAGRGGMECTARETRPGTAT